MKFINKNISIIKEHPISFAFVVIFASVSLIFGSLNKSGGGIFLFVADILFYYFMFYSIHSEDELHNELNEVVKEKGLSKDQVRAITGLNRYELTSGESYELLFNVSSSKRKNILKQLKGYDVHAS